MKKNDSWDDLEQFFPIENDEIIENFKKLKIQGKHLRKNKQAKDNVQTKQSPIKINKNK